MFCTKSIGSIRHIRFYHEDGKVFMATYRERYVAFLDILGFSELISFSVGQNASITVDQIRSILEVPEPVGKEQIVLGRIGDISMSGHRLTAFSDCIIITTDVTEQGLIHLLQHVEKIGFRLARLGALYRGGIARGLVYHDEQYVFGPAVLDAYELEKRAQMPRVLLSDSVIQAGCSAAEPVKTIFSRCIRTDSDGEAFVNYLRILRMMADADGPLPEDLAALHADIQSFVTRELLRFENSPKERHKLEWFEAYFRWATDESYCGGIN